METKHTPGQWYTKFEGVIVDGDGRSVASICTHENEDENAKLIAAAPELLEAAIALVQRWGTPNWKDVPATANYIGRLRAAIAKATGE